MGGLGPLMNGPYWRMGQNIGTTSNSTGEVRPQPLPQT